MKLLRKFIVYVLVQMILFNGSAYAGEFFVSADRNNLAAPIFIGNKNLHNLFNLASHGGEFKPGWANAIDKKYNSSDFELEKRLADITKRKEMLKKRARYARNRKNRDSLKREARNELKRRPLNAMRKKAISVLEEKGFNLQKTMESLGIGRKGLLRLVGEEIIAQGKERQKQKRIELDKERLFVVLDAYSWDIARASEETGIDINRIRELFPINVIERNRYIVGQKMEELLTEILEENQWNVQKALKDQRLIEQKIGRGKLYSIMSTEFIQAQRTEYIARIEAQQKQEIIAAIKNNLNSRSCDREAAKELGLPYSNYKARTAKYNIKVSDIRYSSEIVLPILVETKANLTKAANILGVNRQFIAKKFAKEIEQIKKTGTYENDTENDIQNFVSIINQKSERNVEKNNKLNAQKQELMDAIDKYRSSRTCLKDIRDFLGISQDYLYFIMKKHGIDLNDILYAHARVYPELIETEGNVEQTAENLGLNIDELRKRFNGTIIRVQKLAKQKHQAREFFKQPLVERKVFEALSKFLGISKHQLQNLFRVYDLDIEYFKYEILRVYPVLVETGGNIAETARILGLNETVLLKKYKNEVSWIRTREKYVELIKEDINNKDCLAVVANKLDLSVDELEIILNEYNIHLDSIRYDRRRVLDDLIKTKGDVKQTAENLHLNSGEIRRRYQSEIDNIKNMSAKRQDLIKVVNKSVKNKDYLSSLSGKLELSIDEALALLKEYQINIDDIRYDRERVLNDLKKTDGDVKQTAKNLYLERDIIQQRFSSEIENIQNMAGERQKLVKAINEHMKSKDLTAAVADVLGVNKRQLYRLLAKHSIDLLEVKYANSRVYPVLLETGGNVAEAARILNVDRGQLRIRFKAEIEKIKKRQKIINIINENIASKDCLALLADYFKLSKEDTLAMLIEYDIDLEDMRYDKERVLSDLKKTDGDVNQTAKNLYLDRDIIQQRFSSEIENIQNMAIEKREILEAINTHIKSKTLGLEVSKAVGFKKWQFYPKLRKHGIDLNAIKYSRERVLSDLVETGGDAVKTAKNLSLNIDILRENFKGDIERISREFEKDNAIVAALYANAKDKDWVSIVCKQFNIHPTQLSQRLANQGTSLMDIRYDKSRVYPALMQSGGNVKKAALILNVDRKMLHKRFRSKIIWFKKRQKILDIINNNIKSNDCLSVVANHFKLSEEDTLAMLMEYDIDIEAMRYDKERVLDEFIRTKCNIIRTASNLNLDRFKISEKFAQELIDIRALYSALEKNLGKDDWLLSTSSSLDISMKSLESQINEYGINLNDIMYDRQRVYASLKETGGHIGETAFRLGLNSDMILEKFKKDIDELRENELEKQKIMEVIFDNIDSYDCLNRIALEFYMSTAEAETLLEKHGIDLEAIRYDKKRVFPELVRTEGDVAAAGKNLGLVPELLREKFESEIIKIKRTKAEKQKLLDAIEVCSESVNFYTDVCDVLGIELVRLISLINKHHVKIDDFLYGYKRVYPVLLENGANILKTAYILDLDCDLILSRFKSEINEIQQGEAEKRKIVSLLQPYLKSKTCFADAFKESGFSDIRQFQDLLSRFGLTIEGMKYDRDRVYPDLIETRGDIDKTVDNLGLDRVILENRFAEEINLIRKKSHKAEMSYKFEILGNNVENIVNQIVLNGNKNKEEIVNAKIRVQFQLYRCFKLLECMQRMATSAEYSSEVNNKIRYYKEFFSEKIQMLEDSNGNIELIVSLLEIIKLELIDIYRERDNFEYIEGLVQLNDGDLFEIRMSNYLIDSSI